MSLVVLFDYLKINSNVVVQTLDFLPLYSSNFEVLSVLPSYKVVTRWTFKLHWSTNWLLS